MSEDHEYPPLTSQQRETTTRESKTRDAGGLTPKTPQERLEERVRRGIEASRKRAKEDPHYQVPY